MFISSAHAQAAAASPENSLMSFIPLLVMFGLLYLLMIRPQMKRQKEHKSLLDSLAKGDEVISTGGMLGKIVKAGDSYITLEIATMGDKPVELLVQRSAIQTVLPKGTLKDQR